jgi:hypothetical protein
MCAVLAQLGRMLASFPPKCDAPPIGVSIEEMRSIRLTNALCYTAANPTKQLVSQPLYRQPIPAANS